MGYSSQAGQVILRSQTVQGTYNADTGTAGIGTKIKGGTLAPSRDLMVPDPEIGGNRDIPDAYLGPISWAGDLDFYFRFNMMLTLLRGALGAATVATTTGVSTHTFTPVNTAQLPFTSIEEKVGAGLECFRYNDAVVNTLHLECDPSGYAQGTVGLIAANQIAGATPTASPVWDTSPMCVGTNVSLTYNAVSIPVKSVSIDVNNNFEDDDFRLGSLFLGDLSPKRREVTAGFTIRESAAATWRQAVYGASGATAPQGGAAVKAPLVVTFTSYENIPASTPLTVYSTAFTFPNFALNPYAFGINADDILDDDITGQALLGSGSSVLTVVAKSGLTVAS